MDVIIDTRGGIRCIYSEMLDLHRLGRPLITRASHLEPDSSGQWWADLSPVNGPTLGPFGRRTDALAAEHSWLEEHWLLAPPITG